MTHLQSLISRALKNINFPNQIIYSSFPFEILPHIIQFLHHQYPLLCIIAPSLQNFKDLKSSLEMMNISTFLFPFFEHELYLPHSLEFDTIHQQMQSIDHIHSKIPSVIISDLEGACFKFSPNLFNLSHHLQWKIGDQLDRSIILQTLTQLGYSREEKVKHYGQFALRGEILDIHPIQSSFLYRIRWNEKNQIHSIESFDSNGNTSITSITIAPCHYFKLSENQWNTVIDHFKDHFALQSILKEKEKLKQSIELQIQFSPLIQDSSSFLEFLHLHPDIPIILLNEHDFHQQQNLILQKWNTQFHSLDHISKLKLSPHLAFHTIDETSFSSKPFIFNKNIHTHQATLKNAFELTGNYQGQITLLQEKLTQLKKEFEVLLMVHNQKEKDILQQMFPDENIIEEPTSKYGLIVHSLKIMTLTFEDIFGYKTHQKIQKNLQNTEQITDLAQLNCGDYIVHIKHGIGIFQGIEQLELLGQKKDYIKIEYAQESFIYIPIEQLGFIHKYIGSTTPTLYRPGDKKWKQKTEKAQEYIIETAKELAVLYDKRKHIYGFQFSKDSLLQQQFEANFPYQETPGQLQAIDEIKKDMEEPYPMDRLLCGDVGFGKTEVVMRAAFKAVLSGKQVAVLCPTTILTQQHFYTFSNRFQNFPVKIEMMSRFVSLQKKKITLQELKDGKIDIIIGTHALLSSKFEFNNLGLLVIDEEQKFGVKQKEKLKLLKGSLDVLALSATPIPRTLYMGMSSLRDISLITTPPQNRLPIETYVLPLSQQVVHQALLKEKERGGQSIIISNRIQGINQLYIQLKQELPQLSFDYAHGKMTADDLESIFINFANGNLDVLISTNLIENGIDIPNANTILIYNPEMFGLSEMFQLRGRVGRRDKKAFAYLLYDEKKVLKDTVRQRLEAIEENTELGSGFQIALRDLEIRGAGNMLGEKQSGLFDEIGITLYTQYLKEAVQKAKGIQQIHEIEPLIDLPYEGFIPDHYVVDHAEKFSLYRWILRAPSLNQLQEIEDQINAQYGTLPEALKNIFFMSKIRILCRKIGVKEIKMKNNDIITIQMVENPLLSTDRLKQMIENQTLTLDGYYLLYKSPISQGNILTSLTLILKDLQI